MNASLYNSTRTFQCVMLMWILLEILILLVLKYDMVHMYVCVSACV